MKITFTSTKVFLTALLIYTASYFCYRKASEIYYQELSQSIMGLHSGANLNWWHYAALTSIFLAISATIAAFLLKKLEN